jgi:tetratricopeptide (TPR) repeat protein
MSALLALLLLLCWAPAVAAERGYEADLHYEKGAHALRLGRTTEAVQELARAAELAPEDSASLGLYARALLLEGQPDQAITVLDRLRAVDEDAPDLHLMYGLAYLRLERWTEARDHLETAKKRDPDNGRVRLFLGVAYQKLDQLDDAEREYQEAVRLEPSLKAQVSYRRGLLAISQGRPEHESRAFFEEVVNEIPDSILADSASTHLRGTDGGRRRWSGWASVAYQYDTNPALAGATDVFVPGTVTSDDDYLGLAEVGVDVLALDMRPFVLRVGYRGGMQLHRDETDLDIQENHAWALASYAVDENLSVDLRSTFEYYWADWDGWRRTLSAEPAVNYVFREDLFARAFFRYENRQFFTSSGSTPTNPDTFNRDGRVQTAGFDQYWTLPDLFGWATPSGPTYLRAGFRYRSEDTSGDEFDSHGPMAIGSFGLALPFETHLFTEVWYERRRFKHASIFEPAGGDRKDHITQVRVTLQRPIFERVSLSAGYYYTHWNSNVEVYDFDRNVYELRMTYYY